MGLHTFQMFYFIFFLPFKKCRKTTQKQETKGTKTKTIAMLRSLLPGSLCIWNSIVNKTTCVYTLQILHCYIKLLYKLLYATPKITFSNVCFFSLYKHTDTRAFTEQQENTTTQSPFYPEAAAAAAACSPPAISRLLKLH